MEPAFIDDIRSRLNRIQGELDTATTILGNAQEQVDAAEQAYDREKVIESSQLTKDQLTNHVRELDRLWLEMRRARDIRDAALRRKSNRFTAYCRAFDDLVRAQSAMRSTELLKPAGESC